MTGEARMFNSINTNGNDGYDSITFGDNGKGKVRGLGKIAISNDMSILRHLVFMFRCGIRLLLLGGCRHLDSLEQRGSSSGGRCLSLAPIVVIVRGS